MSRREERAPRRQRLSLQIKSEKEKKKPGTVQRRKEGSENSLCNSWPPTNHGIPSAGAMQFVSINQKKKRSTKESRSGMIVKFILGQGSWGHSHMRTHEARRGDSHLRWSSDSIILSWRGRGRWCICGHTGGQLLEGGQLRWHAGGMTGDGA